MHCTCIFSCFTYILPGNADFYLILSFFALICISFSPNRGKQSGLQAASFILCTQQMSYSVLCFCFFTWFKIKIGVPDISLRFLLLSHYAVVSLFSRTSMLFCPVFVLFFVCICFCVVFYFISTKIKKITCNSCLLYCFTWNKLINIYNPARITFFTYFINLPRRALAPFWFADFKLRSLGVLVAFCLLLMFHCASLVFWGFICLVISFNIPLIHYLISLRQSTTACFW